MLLHQEFLHVEAVDGNTATEADPKEEDANVGLVQLLHVEHPKVDRQLDELADDDWPLTAVQVCQTHDREHRDEYADKVNRPDEPNLIIRLADQVKLFHPIVQ